MLARNISPDTLKHSTETTFFMEMIHTDDDASLPDLLTIIFMQQSPLT